MSSAEDDIFEKIIGVLKTTGKGSFRFIPFDKVWNKFWDSVKKHFFIFEDRKTAVVYFYNDETSDFIGPLYDSGPRFKKEDCKKRYTICGKEAIVIDEGNVCHFMKDTPLHQYPITPLNVSHTE